MVKVMLAGFFLCALVGTAISAPPGGTKPPPVPPANSLFMKTPPGAFRLNWDGKSWYGTVINAPGQSLNVRVTPGKDSYKVQFGTGTECGTAPFLTTIKSKPTVIEVTMRVEGGFWGPGTWTEMYGIIFFDK